MEEYSEIEQYLQESKDDQKKIIELINAISEQQKVYQKNLDLKFESIENSIKVLQNQLQNLIGIDSNKIMGSFDNIKNNTELLILESKKQSVELNRLGHVISNVPLILSDVIVDESEKQLDLIRNFNNSDGDDI